MTRKDNVVVFYDTLNLCKEDYKEQSQRLCDNTEFYYDPAQIVIPTVYPENNVSFVVGGSVSVAYAESIDGTVAMLDFASARKPGGFPERGAFAQEENICRCSNLFVTLANHPEYYRQNKNVSGVYTNGALYARSVTIFKDDVSYKRIQDRQVDVIVCPAPSIAVPDAIIETRAEGIIKLAALKKVDTLILGAWGCGAFGQNPTVVGRAFAKALNNYNFFKKVIFAVRAPVGDRDANNYDALAFGFGSTYEADIKVMK